MVSNGRVRPATDGRNPIKFLLFLKIHTVTGSTTILLDQVSYAPFGAAQSWTWGPSTATMPNAYSRTFDLDGRMATYQLGNPAFSVQAVIRTVSYDGASRITGYSHTGSATASAYDQTFGYDGLGRLTSFVNPTGSQGYGYDASGNRIRLSIGATNFTNTISTTSNRLTAATGPLPAKTNTIDNAGNVISDGMTNYVYSDRGRIKSATKAGLTTAYLYNGLGQRVSKTGSAVGSGGNEYVYDEAGQLIGEYDAAGNVLEETIWFAGAPSVVLKPSTQGGVTAPSIYYVYADHLATPRVITDSGGVIVWSWVDADPFGMTPPSEAPAGGTSFSFNMRFPGQYFDRETALHYNYFRDYDPSTGRYVQSDPLGLVAGINTYAYVGNSPLNAYDPDGLQMIIVDRSPPPGAFSTPSGVGSGVIATGMDGSDRNRSRGSAAEARSRESSRAPTCAPDQKDPCEEIRKKIRDIEQKLASKERQMARNQYDLYNRAYDTNPGGDLAGKGTWVGHMAQIDGLRVGLERAKAEARAMGCL